MSTTARYRSDARHFPPICSAAASCTYVQQGRQLDERSRWQRRFVRNPNQMGIKFDPDRARVEDTTIREGGIVRREKTSGDEEGRMRCHTTRRHLSSSRSFLTPATSSLRFAGKLSSSKVSGFARKFDTSRALASLSLCSRSLLGVSEGPLLDRLLPGRRWATPPLRIIDIPAVVPHPPLHHRGFDSPGYDSFGPGREIPIFAI